MISTKEGAKCMYDIMQEITTRIKHYTKTCEEVEYLSILLKIVLIMEVKYLKNYINKDCHVSDIDRYSVTN